MSGKIRGFLNRLFSPPTDTSRQEREQLLAEIRQLKEELNEHRWEESEARANASAELELLFDEMTGHMRAAQSEIIDSVYQQMLAAEMMRQKQTDRLEELACELAAAREELRELREMQQAQN